LGRDHRGKIEIISVPPGNRLEGLHGDPTHRIYGHTNIRITRLSLAMIVAPAARNLEFPDKFPVTREFDEGISS
jgi:hypothetical protein